MPEGTIRIWPGWQIDHLIGSGGYGKVYEIHRHNGPYLERAALKVIRIPQDRSELEQLRLDGLSEESTEAWFEKQVEEIRDEIGIMQRFVGNSNIVSYEDYHIERREGGFGWDILIRMELLTALPDYMRSLAAAGASMSEEEVIRLGMDISKALDVCHGDGIIHRDVKPQNIFINEASGNFKLGDFGIARATPGTGSVLSFKGTIPYMAPETFAMQNTDERSDIYSLALVMYRILNDGREPFLASNNFTLAQREAAMQKRVAGAEIPPPERGSRELWGVLSKALQYDPSRRYQTAGQLGKALGRIGIKKSAWSNPVDTDMTGGVDTDLVERISPSNCSGTDTIGVWSGSRPNGKTMPEITLSGGGDFRKTGNARSISDTFAVGAGIIPEKDNRGKMIPGRDISGKAGIAFPGNPGRAIPGNAGKAFSGKDIPGKDGGGFKWLLPASILIGVCLAVACFAAAVHWKNEGGGNDETPSAVSNAQTGNDSIEEVEYIDQTDEEKIVPFTVLYRDAEGEELISASSGMAEVDAPVSIIAPEIDGYVLKGERERTVFLSEDEEENVFVYIYEKEAVPIDYNTDGRVTILNRKSSQSGNFEYLARCFKKESGIPCTVETPGAGRYSAALSERVLGGGDVATLFMIGGMDDLEKCGQVCLNLTDTLPAAELSDEEYALKGADGNIYGLGCIVESYGITVNTHLLARAGYEVSDIRSFADLKRIAEDITSRRSELGFAAFTTPTLAGGSSGNYRLAQHASSVPLYYEVRDGGYRTGRKIKGTYLDEFRDFVDLCLDNAVTAADRAQQYSLADAQKEFTDGRAVFHQDGSWSYEKLRDGLGDDIAVIPMYMGIDGEEDFGICETCSYYWCVNRDASRDDIEASLQFLQWLVTSEEGTKIMAEDMDFQIPYEKAVIPDNPYLKTLDEEKKEGLVPVRQYYHYGDKDSWLDAMVDAIEAYALGNGSWSAVEMAFETLW